MRTGLFAGMLLFSRIRLFFFVYGYIIIQCHARMFFKITFTPAAPCPYNHADKKDKRYDRPD